jgi:hypothetical protein
VVSDKPKEKPVAPVEKEVKPAEAAKPAPVVEATKPTEAPKPVTPPPTAEQPAKQAEPKLQQVFTKPQNTQNTAPAPVKDEPKPAPVNNEEQSN